MKNNAENYQILVMPFQKRNYTEKKLQKYFNNVKINKIIN